jgi:transposase
MIMARKRRAFSAVFKAKVALDAIKGLKTSAELAKSHGVHATQIALWKKQLTDDASSIFEATSPRAEKADSPSEDELYAEIGKLKVQLEWLKKKVASDGC